jgi:hypothetical protein
MATIRLYRPEDYKEAQALLAEEGVEKNALKRPDSMSFVMEVKDKIVGLFSLTFRDKLPVLQHFVIAAHLRNFGSRKALKLVKYLDLFIASLGFNYFVVNLKVKRLTVCKTVERYFKDRIVKIKEPKGDLKLYLVRALT